MYNRKVRSIPTDHFVIWIASTGVLRQYGQVSVSVVENLLLHFIAKRVPINLILPVRYHL